MDFKVGDVVWRRIFTQSSKADRINEKLDSKFVPALVRQILGKNIYLLEDVEDGKVGHYYAKVIKAD